MLTKLCTTCDGTGTLGDVLIGPCEHAHQVPCPDCDGGQVPVRCKDCDGPADGFNGSGAPICQVCAKAFGEMVSTAEEVEAIRATAAYDVAVGL